MTNENSSFNAENSTAVADILNTVSGVCFSEFWDSIYEVAGSLETIRELDQSLESLYDAHNYRESFILLLALHDLIALEVPNSMLPGRSVLFYRALRMLLSTVKCKYVPPAFHPNTDAQTNGK